VLTAYARVGERLLESISNCISDTCYPTSVVQSADTILLPDLLRYRPGANVPLSRHLGAALDKFRGRRHDERSEATRGTGKPDLGERGRCSGRVGEEGEGPIVCHE
jgi:hypothetical protein